MTPYEKATIVIQSATFVFLALAVFYYYRQARAGIRQAELLKISLDRSTYAAFETSVLELSKLLVSHNSVRPYFYEGKEMPNHDSPDYNVVMAFAVFYLDFFDNVLTVEKLSPGVTEWTAEAWKSWMMDMLSSSPTLRAVATREQRWYHPELGRLASTVSATAESIAGASAKS